jgi:NADH-quinone oxidoreductase subunit E
MSALRQKFDRLAATYPPHMRASLVLPLLQLVQDEQGHVTNDDALLVAEYAGVPAMQALEVLSWYTMLQRRPVGRNVIKVCRNISCSLRGAERILAHLEQRLGVRAGETTTDGRCTLLSVECLASCGTAPALQVNDTHHDDATEAKIDAILERLA